MRAIWLDSYQPGVPSEIDVNEFRSVHDLLTNSCGKFPHNPAFHNLGTTITYSQLDRMSRDFGAWLQSRPSLQRGSRIAVMMPNILQYPIVLFGILRAGMTVVNVNPLYTPRELQHQLEDSGSDAIVILENFAHVLEKVLPNTPIQHVITTQLGDALSTLRRTRVNLIVKHFKNGVPAWSIPRALGLRVALREGAKHPLKDPATGHDDIAFLQYTGGTTGTSKGAILTHRNVIANVLQSHAWVQDELKEGREIVITALPLYHIFCLTSNCLLQVRMGGLNVLITNPRDMQGFVRELKKWPFTLMTGVNTLFNGLLNTPGLSEVNFSRLKFAIGGGAAIHHSVAERWEAVTGRPLTEGYGLTEASPTVTCNPIMSKHSGSIGLPVPSTEVTIRDDDNRELPVGSQGEICVRGPQVMKGYWRRPDETSQAFTPDGWLRTGDIGVMDERGYLRVTDRKKDMILMSGFNVYPTEVEEVIAAMPGVLECAVVGVPDRISGELVKAFIVPKQPGLTPEGVIAHCRQHLTNYKVPKLVEFRSELPKNPIGKVLRRELRPAGIDADTEVKAASASADSR
jgi:long-chain acyl-CoA synthetase